MLALRHVLLEWLTDTKIEPRLLQALVVVAVCIAALVDLRFIVIGDAQDDLISLQLVAFVPGLLRVEVVAVAIGLKTHSPTVHVDW